MEDCSFTDITNIIALAKLLHDNKRSDILVQWPSIIDEEVYLDACITTVDNIFSKFSVEYLDDENVEVLKFKDALFSNYLAHASRQNRKYREPTKSNSSIKEVLKALSAYIGGSCCIDWSFSRKKKLKSTTNNATLTIWLNRDCYCDNWSKITFGLVDIYRWFKDKVAELELNQSSKKTHRHYKHKKNRFQLKKSKNKSLIAHAG